MLFTAQGKLVSALNALGLDTLSVLEAGEADPPVYLLEQAGAGFGYHFEWERYGPFSEALAADLVQLRADDLEHPDDLDEHLAQVANRVREVIEPPLASLPRATWIRLLASVHFLTRYSGMRLTDGDRPAYLQSPPFEEGMIDTALERVGLLDPQ